MSYTKGPWISEFGAITTTTREESRFIATTVSMTSEFRGEEDGNARLIVAAPELLEALKALRSFMWSEGYADQTPAMAQADEAIAKAEGRSL